MKRTRRIEITRYRRTVTVTQGNDDSPDPEADLSALEVVANEWKVVLPTDEVAGDAVGRVLAPAEIPTVTRRRSFNLRKWLRQRF